MNQQLTLRVTQPTLETAAQALAATKPPIQGVLRCGGAELLVEALRAEPQDMRIFSPFPVMIIDDYYYHYFT